MSRSRIALTVGAALALAAAVSFGVAVGARMLLTRQAAVARRRIGKPLGELAPRSDRVWRKSLTGEIVELLMLGDSIAAGLGADRRKDTLVADVAVIVVGGNDVTHRIPASVSAEHLRAAITRLRARGIPVVVGTCPDLGALRPVPQPLRILGSQMSRQLAAAQAAVAERSGATAVSLRSAVGAVFFDQPDEMFGVDRFHPSALGYRRTAEALLPVVVATVEGRRAGTDTV